MGRVIGTQRLLVIWNTQVNERRIGHESRSVQPGAAIGLHVLADLHGVEAALLRESSALETLLVSAARHAGATVLSSTFRHFGGEYGVTGIVLLAESHITIHTWPEHGFAALDAFMCGQARPHDAVEYIAQGLKAGQVELYSRRRGSVERQIAGA